MDKVEVLKKLALVCTNAESVADVPGDTIVEVLDFIAENFVLEKPEQTQ